MFLIAEAGICHDGSLEIAKKLAVIAKDTGANAVKYQAWVPEQLFVPTDPNREETRRYALSFDELRELKLFCDEIGILFLCTPDDEESLDFLVDEVKIPFIKIGSGELNNPFLLKAAAKKGKPIILSTGMGTMAEVRQAVEWIKAEGCREITLLHCTSAYPTPLKEANISVITNLIKEFPECRIGFSDHTKGVIASVHATLLGAVVIEKHFTYSEDKENLVGPDHKASLSPSELKEWVSQIKRAEMLMGIGIKVPSESEKKNLVRVRKSIVAKHNIPEGIAIQESDLTAKRPGDGMNPNDYKQLIGMVTNRALYKDEKISLEDVR